MVKSDKVLIWGLGGLGCLVVLCLCCVGGLVALPFRWFGFGGPAAEAKSFLLKNPTVLERLGPNPDMGFLPSGSVEEVNGVGTARLEFQMKGTRASGRAVVRLSKERGRTWRVVGAELLVGQETIPLSGPGEGPSPPRSAPEVQANPEPVRS